jgi:hypothetical protein
MLSDQRNLFQYDGWILSKVIDFDKLTSFDCGRGDLNEFFRKDVFIQKLELLNETYELFEATAGHEYPVALISLCNDAIRKEKVIKWLNFGGTKKEYPDYPAVKIARFGVKREFSRQNIGTNTMNMIKTMFRTNNRTGCRFVTVDAYNEPEVLSFYQKNDFQFFSDKDARKQQRAMFYDLKRFTL